MSIRAIVVGRHAPSGKEDIEIVGEVRPIMFPATSEECRSVLEELIEEALEKKCQLLFQAIPAQLSVAIAAMCSKNWYYARQIGAIINIPGPRLTAVSQRFTSDDTNAIVAAVKFVNGRAKVEDINPHEVKITVDPFSPFRFSHIQWFNGETSNNEAKGEYNA